MYDGNDITGGEDALSRSSNFRKTAIGKSVVWTHAFREAELVPLNVVDIGVDGKGREGPLLDEAPELLEPSVDTGGDCDACESKLVEAPVCVPEVVQRPRNRPSGPQGSTGATDEAGDGDCD